MISGLEWSTPAEHPNMEATCAAEAAGREQQIQFK